MQGEYIRETERESHLEVSGSTPAGRKESLADFILFWVCLFRFVWTPKECGGSGLSYCVRCQGTGNNIFQQGIGFRLPHEITNQ